MLLIFAFAMIIAFVYPGTFDDPQTSTTDLAFFVGLSEASSSFYLYLSVARLGLIGLLFVMWDKLVGLCQRSGWITNDTVPSLLMAKHRLCAWLVVIELLLGMQIVSRLIEVGSEWL